MNMVCGWGLSVSIMKTRSVRRGEGERAVIIFIIINFHLKVVPGLFLSTSIFIPDPLHPYTNRQSLTHRNSQAHTPVLLHCYQCLWKGCVPNKAEKRVGAQKRIELKGMGRVTGRDKKKSKGKGGRRSCMCHFITQWTLIYTNRLFTWYGKWQ